MAGLMVIKVLGIPVLTDWSADTHAILRTFIKETFYPLGDLSVLYRAH